MSSTEVTLTGSTIAFISFSLQGVYSAYSSFGFGGCSVKFL